jgi:hypothetical protein
MEYVEVEQEVLDVAHYVTGKEPGSILPGHYFVKDLNWGEFDWADFIREVEREFGAPVNDQIGEKLMEGTLKDFAVYIHELIE